MNREQEYEKHLIEGWYFASCVAEKLVSKENKELQFQLAKAVFKLFCRPYHYFVQNEQHSPSPQSASPQLPSKEQIAYAKDLGIEDPDTFSRRELSKIIKETLKLKRKNEEAA